MVSVVNLSVRVGEAGFGAVVYRARSAYVLELEDGG
jgi:hypothetical protein